MWLARNCLRVQDAAELAAFYVGIMGMQDFGPSGFPAYGYDPAQCLLEFQEGDLGPYEAGDMDFYWKIGITLRDLDAAVDYLQQHAWPVSDPREFRDIGYMCHLRDPQGFAVELLQQGFEDRAEPRGDGHPIGGQAILAHLTLRVTDLAAAQEFCGARLAMRLMSIQPVPERGFTLYFYGWSDEPLPNANLEAVENRQWLWARPYTLLELQHWEAVIDHVLKPGKANAGFAGFAYQSGESRHPTYLPLSEMVDLR